MYFQSGSSLNSHVLLLLRSAFVHLRNTAKITIKTNQDVQRTNKIVWLEKIKYLNLGM